MNRIAELRKSQKLSQKQLGSIIGVAQNTICNWENENREPDYNSLKKMADLFSASIDYLLGRTDEKVQPPTDDSKRLDRNVIKIAGRDGSNYEYAVSDGQRELVRQMLDNFKLVEEERT